MCKPAAHIAEFHVGKSRESHPDCGRYCTFRHLLRSGAPPAVHILAPSHVYNFRDVDGLAQLAAAWPNIQVLRVTLHDSTARVSVNNTHPTIAALVTFAQRCPVLWSLSLPSLDFSSVHPTVFVPLIPRHPLSRLSISTAVCGGASAVQAAVSLNRLFPELEYLGVWSAHLSGPGDPGASGAFRSQIRGIMDALRGVREHERMRAELLVAEGERRTG